MLRNTVRYWLKCGVYTGIWCGTMWHGCILNLNRFCDHVIFHTYMYITVYTFERDICESNRKIITRRKTMYELKTNGNGMIQSMWLVATVPMYICICWKFGRKFNWNKKHISVVVCWQTTEIAYENSQFDGFDFHEKFSCTTVDHYRWRGTGYSKYTVINGKF